MTSAPREALEVSFEPIRTGVPERIPIREAVSRVTFPIVWRQGKRGGSFSMGTPSGRARSSIHPPRETVS